MVAMARDTLPMHYSDLDLSTQLGLLILVVVLSAGFLMRALVFFRLESAGLPPLYPDSWNVAQCRALERFRLLIGLGLIPLWGVYLFIAPSMPANWSFGYLGQLISLIAMLSASYAWIVLLAARNWKRLDALPQSFLLIIAFLVLWWGAAFSAIGWMLAEASTPPKVHMFSGVYAAREMPRFVWTAGYPSRIINGK
jgi:hypothetical protein